MTSYIQTTIHSKVAKQGIIALRQQKTTNDGIGQLRRGRVAAGVTKNSPEREIELTREIEILPKSKVNVSRKMKNKVIPSANRGEQIILMESGVFPAIYFKKTTMRNILKEFVFPHDVRALPPADDRTPLIYQIVSNLFNEITFFIFNILVGQNKVTNSFYIFFSDSETIPFTKCCNAPVYVELQPNGSGKIQCNALKCPHSNIAEFLINFEDGRKLWTSITYFAQASEKDKELRHRISKVIGNGRFRKTNLVEIVQETSKQIVDLFYNMKKGSERALSQQNQATELDAEGNEQTPFITAGYHKQKEAQPQSEEANVEEPSLEALLTEQQKNIDMLKMKIGFVARRDRDLSRKIARSIVNEGKVFHKNFDMIRKIDEFMLTQKSSKGSSKFTFPRLMDQLRKAKNKGEKEEGKGRSVSAYHSFA